MSPKKSNPAKFKYDEAIQRALVVVAHPDDVDFGSAGTVATLTKHGVDVPDAWREAAAPTFPEASASLRASLAAWPPKRHSTFDSAFN